MDDLQFGRSLVIQEQRDEPRTESNSWVTSERRSLEGSDSVQHEIIPTEAQAPKEDKGSGGQRPKIDFTSFWLQQRTLLFFTALFVALAASTVAVWIVNRSQNGFSIALSSNHYAWTYGPTAILTIVLSLWRQVDYYCKILQPWQELHQSLADADNSVLLDYVSPIFATSLVMAIWRRHYPVVASITGFVLLKMVILFSTGLLVLAPTIGNRSEPVTVTTKFDFDRCSSPWLQTKSFYMDYLMASAYDVSSRPAFTFMGLLNGTVPNSSGTLGNSVFQSFELDSGSKARTVSVEVDVFQPNISCEIAEVSILPGLTMINSTTYLVGTDTMAFTQVQLKSASCLVGSHAQPALDMRGRDTYSGQFPGWQTEFAARRVNCSDMGYIGEDFDSHTFELQPETSWDIRYAIMISNMSYIMHNQTGSVCEQSGVSDINSEGNDSSLYIPPDADGPSCYNETNSTITSVPQHPKAVICKVGYGMGRKLVKFDVETNSYEIGVSSPHGRFGSLTDLMLGETVISSIFGASLTNGMNLEDFLVESSPTDRHLDRLFSASALQEASEKVLGGVATQYMQQICLFPGHLNATGISERMQDRLHVSIVSSWAMFSCFLVLSGCTLCIVRTRHRDLGIQDPSSVLACAAVLRRSRRLQRLLKHTGNLRTSQLTALLQRYKFQTTGGIKIHVESDSHPGLAVTDNSVKGKNDAWVPLAARPYTIVATFVIPLIAIIALQLLYNASALNSGIIDVSGYEDRASYLSRYISAAVMLLIATCFNCLDFAIASFAPYTLARSPRPTNGSDLSFEILGKLPPIAIWHSLSKRHYSSALSSIAVFLGSILAIAASGLWTVGQDLVLHKPVEVSPTDSWNIDWIHSSSTGDGGAATRLNNIHHGSSIMPSTIWGHHVLPGVADVRPLRMQPGENLEVSNVQNFLMDVDGLSSVLECDVVADDDIAIDYQTRDAPQSSYTEVSITATPELKPGCQHAGINGTNKFYTYRIFYDLYFEQKEDARTAAFYDLHLGPWTTEPFETDIGQTNAFSEYSELYAKQFHDNPAGCPSIGVIAAKIGGNMNSTKPEDVTALLCSQKIASTALQVTYTRNNGSQDLTLNTTVKPTYRPLPPHYLTNGTAGIDTFPYRVQTYLEANLSTFAQNDSSNPYLDNFFNHLVFGPNGSPIETIIGKQNRQALITAVQQQYAQYMSLVIDAKFRSPRTEEDGKSTISGTYQVTASRLQMDFTSKLVLQILLAVMTLLGIAAYLLSDLGTTLPRKPTSIASVMGFLAGSDLCDETKGVLPDGPQWKNLKELSDFLDGWVISLGWWSCSSSKLDGVETDLSERYPGVEQGEIEAEAVDSLLKSQESQIKQRRFGFDVGVPEQYGYRETKWQRLRRRVPGVVGRQRVKSAL